MASRRIKSPRQAVSLRETLVLAGLEPRLADLLDGMPHRIIEVEPRRPFREPGTPRSEVMFVRSGILAKFKSDGSGRRQIVSLRFPGEGILPHEGTADYGLQAIVRSEVLVGKADDFDAIVNANPDVARFFWKLVQRQNAIGYEWLVNTGRRDSTARVAHLLCETATRMGIDAASTGEHVTEGHREFAVIQSGRRRDGQIVAHRPADICKPQAWVRDGRRFVEPS